MHQDVDEALKNGRLFRNGGHPEEAIRHYELAARLARSHGDDHALAHALRHVADIARELGNAKRALEASEEAVLLYRAYGGTPLDLANALRVNALALQAAGQVAAAQPVWTEARHLYDGLDVRAGVEECDLYLDGRRHR